MKWIRRIALAALLLAGAVIAALWLTALRTERPVGFQSVVATTGSAQRVAMGVWYPTTATTWPTTLLGMVVMDVAADGPVAGSGLPLVVISHGNGGGPGGHADLALALASAGYVVAAPMHTGDNYTDQSGLASVHYLGNRTRELRAAVDYMLGQWNGRTHIDPGRIGAYGFSAGGLTVLTAAGARPDLAYVAKYCATAQEFTCGLLRELQSPLVRPGSQLDDTWSRDARLQAAVVAAPALGFAMRPGAFDGVEIPVQVWEGALDTNVVNAIDAVRNGLGERGEYHRPPGAGHFSFLVPCGLVGPPGLCKEQGEFNRMAFHTEMNRSVVAFFNKHMPKR